MTDKGLFRLISIFIVAGISAGCLNPRTREGASFEFASSQTDPVTGVRAELSASEAFDGSLLALNVEFPAGLKGEDLHAEFEASQIPLYSTVDDGKYEGWVGIPHSYKPGSAMVSVHYKVGDDAKVINLGFVVNAGKYEQEQLSVDGNYVNPGAKALRRIKREGAEISGIYRRVLAKKYWSGPFALPIESSFTSPYGTKRMYNGEQRNFHGGLDLKAAVGAPILSPAAGEVVLAKDIYFTGGTVILDHGYGVITVYAHMSKIQVKKGQIVSAKQLLGLAGATGRVSGPHLHWMTVVNRVKVNPVEFLRVLR